MKRFATRATGKERHRWRSLANSRCFEMCQQTQAKSVKSRTPGWLFGRRPMHLLPADLPLLDRGSAEPLWVSLENVLAAASVPIFRLSRPAQ